MTLYPFVHPHLPSPHAAIPDKRFRCTTHLIAKQFKKNSRASYGHRYVVFVCVRRQCRSEHPHEPVASWILFIAALFIYLFIYFCLLEANKVAQRHLLSRSLSHIHTLYLCPLCSAFFDQKLRREVERKEEGLHNVTGWSEHVPGDWCPGPFCPP